MHVCMYVCMYVCVVSPQAVVVNDLIFQAALRRSGSLGHGRIPWSVNYRHHLQVIMQHSTTDEIERLLCCICMYVCMNVYSCMYVCMYVCVNVYIRMYL